MDLTPNRTGKRLLTLTNLTTAMLVAAVMVGGLSITTARARDNGGGHHEAHDRGHEHYHGHDHHGGRGYYDDSPSYVYAPPTGYYVSPPAPPLIDVVIPLRFR